MPRRDKAAYLLTLFFFRNLAAQLLQGCFPSHLVFLERQRSQLAHNATAAPSSASWTSSMSDPLFIVANANDVILFHDHALHMIYRYVHIIHICMVQNRWWNDVRPTDITLNSSGSLRIQDPTGSTVEPIISHHILPFLRLNPDQIQATTYKLYGAKFGHLDHTTTLHKSTELHGKS